MPSRGRRRGRLTPTNAEELLFDDRVVGARPCPGINANTTALAAVQTALAGSGLIVRRAASGALIIEAAATPVMAQPDTEVSEVLVVGHRSQNADIRRTETDIQPYKVVTGDQLVSAHVDDIGQYFDTRVTRDPGINVARWNMYQRDFDLVDQRFVVDGGPLRCFHFSAFNPADPTNIRPGPGGRPRPYEPWDGTVRKGAGVSGEREGHVRSSHRTRSGEIH